MTAQIREDAHAPRVGATATLPVAVFVERWRLITGEPPAILLGSQEEMLALLIKSTPTAPFEAPVPIELRRC